MEFTKTGKWLSTKLLRVSITTCLLAAILLPSPATAIDNSTHDVLNRLDSKFRSLSSDVYIYTAKNFADKLPSATNISQLLKLVEDSIAHSDDVTAIKLLHKNRALIMRNIDNSASFTFIELLLKNNELYFAEKIYSAIKEEGDKSLLANANFIFAKYYADRSEWTRTNKLLENVFSELKPDDSAYAHLLKGVALQETKKHRKAIKFYDKIPKDSQYFKEAQLNIAIGNIRQGWWTDANNIITKAVNNGVATKNSEILNRLHLVLGYALLQREYYRNARNAFRNVALDSRYANRALLGIGLTATSQGDYVGGLNALSILKQKSTFDLSVDESYLLLPYVYDKLQQEITVSASYSEAMGYYKKRIASLKALIDSHKIFSQTQYDFETSTLLLSDNQLDYGATYPVSFLKNYQLLLQLKQQVRTKSLGMRIERLIGEYDSAFQKIANSLLKQRLAYLNSYLNQSRYGFAKFLDSNSETASNE